MSAIPDHVAQKLAEEQRAKDQWGGNLVNPVPQTPGVGGMARRAAGGMGGGLSNRWEVDPVMTGGGGLNNRWEVDPVMTGGGGLNNRYEVDPVMTRPSVGGAVGGAVDSITGALGSWWDKLSGGAGGGSGGMPFGGGGAPFTGMYDDYVPLGQGSAEAARKSAGLPEGELVYTMV